MSLVIWKYRIDPERATDLQAQEIRVPAYSKTLSFGSQGYEVYVWLLVGRETEATHSRFFRAYLTGEAIPNEPGEFIGTAMTQSGMVIHLFEVSRAA